VGRILKPPAAVVLQETSGRGLLRRRTVTVAEKPLVPPSDASG
jgi:hypothetical protein